jgi:molecular chaperone HscC
LTPLVTIDPDTAVGLGAAVQAGLKARDAALEDTVMTDVCPFTLGVAVVDYLDAARERRSDPRIEPIIERNAVVPISRSKTFSATADGQGAVRIEVYQGEHLRPENNVHLGSLRVEIPQAPAGREGVDVRFTYDINGALEVDAKVLSTGLIRQQIFRNSSGLSDDELATRFKALAEIKLHPRDQLENRTLIARAERLYAEVLGEQREVILHGIRQFETGLADQRNRNLAQLRKDFSAFLDRLSRSPLDVS